MPDIQQSISDSEIDRESSYGSRIRNNPRSILPKRPIADPTNFLLDALLGAGAGIKASADVARYGDPLTALLAGSAGALSSPRSADIQAQREAQMAEAELRALEASTLPDDSPLVIEHPEFKGMPLGAIYKLAPMIQRYDFMKKKLADKDAAAKSAPTPAQKAVDVQFGKEYAQFIAAGGAADVRKNLNQLRGAVVALKSGKENLTGPMLGRVSPENRTLLPGGARSSEIQQDVEDVVQRNLRMVLGAQFTENEGNRLIARAYDPRLDEQTNARRLERLINQIEQAALAKEDAANYYEQHGTLTGFSGKLYTSPSQFLNDSPTGPEHPPEPKQPSGGTQKKTSSGKPYVLEVVE